MFRLVLCLALVACSGSHKPAPDKPSNKILVLVDEAGIGLGGHDPTAYQASAVEEGTADNTSSFGGAKYLFVNADNKTKFDGDMKKYAPAFGGYCAFAASQNRLSEADPSVYLIHEGQLLVFTNQDFLDQFRKDPVGNKKLADANWPGLVEKHGKPR